MEATVTFRGLYVGFTCTVICKSCLLKIAMCGSCVFSFFARKWSHNIITGASCQGVLSIECYTTASSLFCITFSTILLFNCKYNDPWLLHAFSFLEGPSRTLHNIQRAIQMEAKTLLLLLLLSYILIQLILFWHHDAVLMVFDSWSYGFEFKLFCPIVLSSWAGFSAHLVPQNTVHG